MRKYLKESTIFLRGPSWMYDWVLNTPLKSFVQDAPRIELATAPVVECLTTTGWQKAAPRTLCLKLNFLLTFT